VDRLLELDFFFSDAMGFVPMELGFDHRAVCPDTPARCPSSYATFRARSIMNQRIYTLTSRHQRYNINT
jgi:hypothetical protein